MGSIGGGLELFRDSWKRIHHVFACRTLGQEHNYGPQPQIVTQGPRFPLGLLSTHPVDILVVDHGTHQKPITDLSPSRWLSSIEKAPPLTRPSLVIEVWPPASSTWERGPTGKIQRTLWTQYGYFTRIKRIQSTRVGGAINQSRLLVIRTRHTQFVWPSEEPDTGCSRPMSNLLTPPGLLKRSQTERGTTIVQPS